MSSHGSECSTSSTSWTAAASGTRRYVFSKLERSDPYAHYVRVAQLYGLEKDIHITDTQYLIALTVFFFPYSLLEVCVTTTKRLGWTDISAPKPASNVILKKARPSRWLSFLMLGWGIVMVGPCPFVMPNSSLVLRHCMVLCTIMLIF